LNPIRDFPWEVSGRNWNGIISIHTDREPFPSAQSTSPSALFFHSSSLPALLLTPLAVAFNPSAEPLLSSVASTAPSLFSAVAYSSIDLCHALSSILVQLNQPSILVQLNPCPQLRHWTALLLFQLDQVCFNPLSGPCSAHLCLSSSRSASYRPPFSSISSINHAFNHFSSTLSLVSSVPSSRSNLFLLQLEQP
jgi:hypothetical protein